MLALAAVLYPPVVFADGFGEKARFTTSALSDPRFVARVGGGAFLVADRSRVVKFSKAGRRVRSFGTRGVVEVAADDGSTVRGLEAAPDGGFVALTAIGRPRTGIESIAVQAFTADGEPRTDFATGGSLHTSLSGSRGYEPQLEVDGSGRIVVGASSALTRWTSMGQPDATFGSGGTVTLDGLQVGGDIRINEDGHLVILAAAAPITSDSPRTQMLRLLSDGQPDPSFQGDGSATLPFALIFYEFLAVDSAGEPIFAGEQPCLLDDLRCSQATVSLNPDGSPRPEFGDDGSVSWPHVGTALDEKGRLALAGTAGRNLGRVSPQRDSFYLVRLKLDGERRGGLRFATFGDRSAEMTAVSDALNEKVIAVGRVSGKRSRTGIALFSLK